MHSNSVYHTKEGWRELVYVLLPNLFILWSMLAMFFSDSHLRLSYRGDLDEASVFLDPCHYNLHLSCGGV